MSSKPTDIARGGVLLVLSAPSGAGKTSIALGLLAGDPKLKRSISVTTRDPRPGEVRGADYHFIGRKKFDAMVGKGELLEHATVHGQSYGARRSKNGSPPGAICCW
jgi:guanylate kinase